MKIYLLLTEKCNLNCRMCIRGKKDSTELSLSVLKQINWLNELKNHDITITGGEPTLCHDFIPIVQFLSGIAKSIYICTNGINNYYISKDFFAQGVKIQISIDGNERTHNEIRGKQTFQKTFETIEKLENLNIPYTISTVVSKKNIESMISLSDRLAKLKFMEKWHVSCEMPFGSADLNEILPANEWNHFVDRMLDYVNFRMRIQKLFPFDLFDKNKKLLDSVYLNRICTNCSSGKGKVYIYPDLTVYPCTCLTDFPIGNFKEKPLSLIMKSKSVEIFSKYHIVEESKCNNCDYLKYCNGGCIGMSYKYFNKLGMGDIRCPKINESNMLDL